MHQGLWKLSLVNSEQLSEVKILIAAKNEEQNRLPHSYFSFKCFIHIFDSKCSIDSFVQKIAKFVTINPQLGVPRSQKNGSSLRQNLLQKLSFMNPWHPYSSKTPVNPTALTILYIGPGMNASVEFGLCTFWWENWKFMWKFNIYFDAVSVTKRKFIIKRQTFSTHSFIMISTRILIKFLLESPRIHRPDEH